MLHTGDRVAADARLLEEINLKADEALLTGESTARARIGPGGRPRPRRGRPEVHGVRGHGDHLRPGRAVVTATGMDTEFGKIARMLEDVTEDKPPWKPAWPPSAGSCPLSA